MKWILLLVTLLALPVAGVLDAGAAPPADREAVSDVARLMTHLGFDDRERQRVEAGQIVVREMAPSGPQEVALAVAVMSQAPVSRIVAAVRRGDAIEAARPVIAQREIVAGKEDDAFGRFDFAPGVSAEVRRLLAVEPGATFNLSAEEIGRLHALAGGAAATAARETGVQAAMTEGYRQVLAGRYRAYRAGGAAAIAPYDRGGGRQASPAAALRAAGEASALLAEELPAFHRAMMDYPAGDDATVEHSFRWLKVRLDDRPTAILSHRMIQEAPDHAVIAGRDFFVGHGYDARQTIIACFAVESGTLVVYATRASSDEIAGPHPEQRRAVFQQQVRDRVVDHFRRVREAAERKRSSGGWG